MNFLGRQIFPFAIDWSAAVQRSVTFDLRETALGFGAEYFTPTAQYDVTGWEFSLHHETSEEIRNFESFADSLVGRLQGFWLPCPLQTAEFVGAYNNQIIMIKKSGWAQTWNQRPDQFLLFTFPDGTQAAAQILTVAAGDASGTWPANWNIPLNNINPAYDYVFLKQPLPEVPAAGVTMTRLHYVRFAGDVEELQFQGEGIAQMKITVVELPLEYTLAATGLQPIYLYVISMKAPVNMQWFYTSFAAPVVSNGKLYQAWPMTHGAIKQTTDGNSNPVNVTAKYDATHPFSMLGGTPPGAVMWITIMRCYLGTPNNTTNIFVGFVDFVDDGTDKVVATCHSRLYWLRTKLPRFNVGTICNWMLYDPNTCQVGRAFFETTVTIATVAASALPQVQCTFNFNFQLANWQTQNWFTGGTFETGVGLNYELRTIVASQWVPPAGGNPGYLLLTLNSRLKKNGAGAQCEITAGCDHTAEGKNGCAPKFNNFKNFGAFVDVPEENLSLRGIDNNSNTGNKKS